MNKQDQLSMESNEKTRNNGFSLRIGAWAFLLSALTWLGIPVFHPTHFLENAMLWIIALTLLICGLIGFVSGLISLLAILIKKQKGLWKSLAGLLISLINFALGVAMGITYAFSSGGSWVD